MEQNRTKVYLETSFISYMVGKDTSNVKKCFRTGLDAQVVG